ncbi:MAG TPA: GNAT family N-acetyltransferase [Acidocella sp.]|nr:GNAT family N-acetyltransferase [Acidocella sp.]
MAIRQIAFHEADFALCFDIRLIVFVAEQNVPLEEERDEHEMDGLHFLAEIDGKPVGTARALRKGDFVKITRLAVLREARGQGIGEALMRHIEAFVPARRFALDAQIQALPFYARLGYIAQGEVFMDAGIPHQRMTKEYTDKI